MLAAAGRRRRPRLRRLAVHRHRGGQRVRRIQAGDRRQRRGGHRLFRSLHRRSRQLPALFDRQRRARSRQSRRRKPRHDEVRLGRIEQVQGLADIWGSGQGIGAVDRGASRGRIISTCWPSNMPRPKRGSALADRLQRVRQSAGISTGRRVARSTTHMDELALRGRRSSPSAEHADAVADARPAELGDRQARPRHPAEMRAARNSEQRVSTTSAIGSPVSMSSRPCSTSQRVHRAVEPLIKDGVVDVAVGVIVGPAGREPPPSLELGPSRRRFAAHQAAS